MDTPPLPPLLCDQDVNPKLRAALARLQADNRTNRNVPDLVRSITGPRARDNGPIHSLHQVLKFFLRLFRVNETMGLKAAGKRLFDAEGYCRVTRDEIYRVTKLKPSPVTRALDVLVREGIINRRLESQENLFKHSWMRLNPWRLFELLDALPNFRAARKEKLAAITVARATPAEAKAVRTPASFFSEVPVTLEGQISYTGGCPPPAVGPSSFREGAHHEEKICCAGVAGQAFAPKEGPATPASPPAVPSTEDATAPVFPQFLGMDVVATRDLAPAQSPGDSVRCFISTRYLPVLDELGRIPGFLATDGANVTDADTAAILHWCDHQNPEVQMTRRDVERYAAWRLGRLNLHDESSGWMTDCPLAVFLRSWPRILAHIRRQDAASKLEELGPQILALKNPDGAVKDLLHQAAREYVQSPFFGSLFPPGTQHDIAAFTEDECLAWFVQTCRWPLAIAYMADHVNLALADTRRAGQVIHPDAYRELQRRHRQWILARIVLSARAGERWPELMTPAALATYRDAYTTNPVFARLVDHARWSDIYPTSEASDRHACFRDAARARAFLEKVTATIANAKFRETANVEHYLGDSPHV